MSAFGGTPANQFGSKWGTQPPNQGGGRTAGKPALYAPQPLLWFGRQTMHTLQAAAPDKPISTLLTPINYGDVEWKSYLKVNAEWLSVPHHNLNIPPGCILRLPVRLVVDKLAEFQRQPTLKSHRALIIEKLPELDICAWLYLAEA